MGMSMFKNLTKYKELSPQGFDIDNDKLSTLKKMNLKQASNIEEIYKTNDIIITCLPGGKHVEHLYYKENAMSFIRKNQIIIDMSTSQPDLMLKLEKDLKIKDAFIADAISSICKMPLNTNVLNMTIMANDMPFVGRG